MFVESGRLLEAVGGPEGLSWKISVIEAGLSETGRSYSEDVLKAAVPLFDGVKMFADHPSVSEEMDRPERSTSNIVGWITEPRWDESEKRIVGTMNLLKTHPIAERVLEAYKRGRTDLYELSIYGSGKTEPVNENGKTYFEVKSIDKIVSVDLVTFGAAGGRIEKLIASIRNKEDEMDVLKDLSAEEILELRPDLLEAVKPEAEEEEDTSLREELEALRNEVALERCKALAQTKIDTSGLPKAMKDRLYERFVGRVFETQELEEAIEAEKNLYSSILEQEDIRPRVHVVRDEKDKFIDAMTATVLGPGKLENGTPGFRSIKQAYCVWAGLDYWKVPPQELASRIVNESIGFMPGTFMPGATDNLREAISWSYVFGTSMNRALAREYQVPAFDDWRKIVSAISSLENLKQQEIVRYGYYGTLPIVSAGGTYQEATSPSDVRAYYSPSKRGVTEEWTWEDVINDDLRALQRIPGRLALAAKATIYKFVFDFLNDNATCTFDDTALFHADHSNIGSTALSTTTLTAAKVAMRSQSASGASAIPLGLKPKWLVVPNELEATAVQLRDSDNEVVTAKTATVANPHRGTFDIIVVDYWTDSNNWYCVADPALVPTIEVGFLGGREEPELFTQAPNTGSSFTADKVVIKIRHVFGGAIVDYRGFYGAIVS